MIPKQKYSTYPAEYRAREMAILARWIQAGESGSIVGLGGAGKSNFLGFLCHRPEVIQAYLPDHMNRLALVLVDLNNMPSHSLDTFYRVILRAMYEARAQFATFELALAEAIEHLYRKVEEKTDPFIPQSALREVLLFFQEKGVRLVLVLDPFDRFCQVTSAEVLDNLRGLRDGFKANLSYLAGLRQELLHLAKWIETSELYEILDTHRCWLGPMEATDARWVISQREEATGQSFSEAACHRLIELTGGYPALLRAASLWLAAKQQAGVMPNLTEWDIELMAEPSLKNRLEDLRQSLTGAEEATLFVLQKALAMEPDKKRDESLRQIEEKYKNTLNELVAKRLYIQTKAGWDFFSPLFAQFVAQMEGVSLGQVWHEPKTNRFYQGQTELTDLSKQDRQLLNYFLANPHKICSIDELFYTVWLDDIKNENALDKIDEKMISDQTVQQAIRHLRTKLELNPAKPRYLINVRGGGYYFDPDGAPAT